MTTTKKINQRNSSIPNANRMHLRTYRTTTTAFNKCVVQCLCLPTSKLTFSRTSRQETPASHHSQSVSRTREPLKTEVNARDTRSKTFCSSGHRPARRIIIRSGTGSGIRSTYLPGAQSRRQVGQTKARRGPVNNNKKRKLILIFLRNRFAAQCRSVGWPASLAVQAVSVLLLHLLWRSSSPFCSELGSSVASLVTSEPFWTAIEEGR